MSGFITAGQIAALAKLAQSEKIEQPAYKESRMYQSPFKTLDKYKPPKKKKRRLFHV